MANRGNLRSPASTLADGIKSLAEHARSNHLDFNHFHENTRSTPPMDWILLVIVVFVGKDIIPPNNLMGIVANRLTDFLEPKERDAGLG